MKVNFFTIAIIFLMVISSIGAVGTQLDNESKDVDDGILTIEELERLQAKCKAEDWTFTVGKNSATNRSISQLCGLVIPDNWEKNSDFKSITPSSVLPDHFDWSNANYNYKNKICVTSIKDQKCGDCWAFGTVAPLESLIIIKDNVIDDLSEQWLKSCNTNGYSCNGGWWAHQWHAGTNGKCGGTGAVEEEDCRYSSSTGSCNGPYPHKYLVTDWGYIGSEHGVANTNSIKQAIYDHGPVSTAVYVDSTFQSYTGGIYTGIASPGRVNHAVVLVGWNDNDGCWILRNSWGTDWGENGYMKIKYKANNVGYSTCYVGDYITQFSGEEAITLQIKEVTNEGDDYEPIDVNALLQPLPPEWFYKVEMGGNFHATIENLKPGEGSDDDIWPYDDFVEEYTWDVEADTKGHVIYTNDQEVSIKFGFYDWDAVSAQDHADISPKSSRDFEGTYNLYTNELKYSDGTKLEKTGSIYVIKGPKTSDWKCDNAQVKFIVTDTFSTDQYPPKLGAPSSYDMGSKSQYGSFTGSFTIQNLQTHPWSEDLVIQSVTVTSGSDWINSASSSTNSIGPSGTSSVTVKTNDIRKNGDYSGTIQIKSNGGTKDVGITLKMAKSRSKSILILSDIIELKYSSLSRLIRNLTTL